MHSSSDSASFTSAALDRVACSSCGYRLRGLDPRGDCPECGQAIAISRGRSLVNAPKSWLNTVSNGLRLIAFAAFGAVGAVALMAVIAGALLAFVNVTGTFAMATGVTFLVVLIAVLIVMWIGTARLTEDPPDDVTIGDFDMRTNIRQAYGLAVLGNFCCAPLGWVCWPWYFYQLGLYTGALARQAGVPKLGRSTQWAGYVAAAGFAGSTASGFAASLVPEEMAVPLVVSGYALIFIGMLWVGITFLKLERTLTRIFIDEKLADDMFE